MLDNKYFENQLNELSIKLQKLVTPLSDELNEMKKKELEWEDIEKHGEKIVKAQADQVVSFNVSGQIFQTTIGTLMNIKDTLFYNLIVSERVNLDQEIFINRSPKHFSNIINYLRTKHFSFEKHRSEEMDEFYIEAQYYELNDLVQEMGNRFECSLLNFTRSGNVSYYYENEDEIGTGNGRDIQVGTNFLEDLNETCLNTGICTSSPAYIIIELNHEFEFEEIVIGGYDGTKYEGWFIGNGSLSTILTSSNGKQWTKVGEIPTNYGQIQSVKLLKSIGKYIKFFNEDSQIGIGYLKIVTI